jgi:hypothetical protein
VLCSISEGFPYTLIEAMTCGRPCVATDVGGVTEAAGDTGLVVPPRHPAELAQACLTLLRDRELRKRLGDAARLRALEYFTVDRAISAFDEIYMFLGTGRPLPTPQPAGAGPLDAVPTGRDGLDGAGQPAGRRLSVVPEPGRPGQDIAGQGADGQDEREARQTREETA